MPHVGAKIVMKCDIRKFFGHITFAMVRAKVFPISRYSEANSILLSILCVYEDSTPQGGLCRAQHKPPYDEIDVMPRYVQYS